MISAMVTYNPSVKAWNFPMQEAAENETRKRCHEQRLLNTVSPTALQSNPAFGWRVRKKKKIWQWSDCSPSTSNPTISNPSMSCAGKGRHRLGLPQVAGNPKGKGEGTHCFQETKSPRQDRSHHDLSSPNKEGGWARRYSPVLFVQRTQSQQHGSVSCFLSNHLPTTRKTTEVCQESAIFWISK